MVHVIDIHEIIPKVNKICAQENTIIAAYIFGSLAKKKIFVEDVDIALLMDSKSDETFSILDFITEIEKACGLRADVVILNRATELIKFEVRRTGMIIFERDTRKRIEFEIYSRKTFEDFLYLHKRYVNTVLYKRKNG